MGVEQRKVTTAEQPEMLLGVTAIKPPDRSGMEALRYFIHNPETGAFFSRTPKSWFLITLFYCVYYTCLACFWYGLMVLFLNFLPEDTPKYMGVDGIIGDNPGVGMRPAQPDVTIDSSMLFLQWNAKNEQPSHDFESASNIDWAKRYEKFLEKYKNTTLTKECSGNDFNADKDPACRFNVDVLGECAHFPYGFQVAAGGKQVEPCVLLKINRIYGWEPKSYTEEDLNDEEQEIPESVKALVRSDPDKIYLDCQGENPADREALEGKIRYFPDNRAIDYSYFPYTQSGGNYQNPLVAVKFAEIPVGQLFHVECKMWTKGVRHSRKDRLGQVHFEIILDDKQT